MAFVFLALTPLLVYSALEYWEIETASIPPALLSTYVPRLEEPSKKGPDHSSKRGYKSAAGVDMMCAGSCLILSLPLEIRLQIFDWVYRPSTMQKKVLCMAYLAPTRQARVTLSVQDEDTLPSDYRDPCVFSYKSPRPASITVSSEVLRLDHQTYTEAREIPSHDNEFNFRNWPSLGFMRSLLLSDVLEP